MPKATDTYLYETILCYVRIAVLFDIEIARESVSSQLASSFPYFPYVFAPICITMYNTIYTQIPISMCI